jgi:DNA-binding sugar fermentation-stimulating protein
MIMNIKIHNILDIIKISYSIEFLKCFCNFFNKNVYLTVFYDFQSSMGLGKSRCDVFLRTPKSLLDPSWVQVSQTMELFGIRGTFPVSNTKRGRGAC